MGHLLGHGVPALATAGRHKAGVDLVEVHVDIRRIRARKVVAGRAGEGAPVSPVGRQPARRRPIAASPVIVGAAGNELETLVR